MLIPAVNLPFLYVNNFLLTGLTNTTLTYSAGQARDSTNTLDIQITESTTINAAVNGANGLDTGSLANNTWYYTYAISSSANLVPNALIISTSASGPVFTYAQGYDSYRLIDVNRTNGSAQFLLGYKFGNGTYRKHIWDVLISVLTSGTSATYEPVSCVSAIPPISQLGTFYFSYFTNAAGDGFYVRPTGSSSTTNLLFIAPVNSIPSTGQFVVNTNASQSIDYKATASDDLSLSVCGFDFFI